MTVCHFFHASLPAAARAYGWNILPGVLPGDCCPFSVGLISLEKQVVLESRCWKQQKWSFFTCNLNGPSPASSQSSIHTSAYDESSEALVSTLALWHSALHVRRSCEVMVTVLYEWPTAEAFSRNALILPVLHNLSTATRPIPAFQLRLFHVAFKCWKWFGIFNSTTSSMISQMSRFRSERNISC